ncbi:hypothetical protein C8P66_102123 [Humitalea rosea]|uniref:Uncharacterized protein n=1 Tax=Humitalea rosea TaxID=990373 RepID=A0A2W7KQ22_9PROT|nr:hypothetical protein [Humitalea rosea]PZW50435.1 hypothetical protein C8P66_102123 [Humitalea rosea]
MPQPAPRSTRRLDPLDRALPFHSSEEAWFWTMSALTARRDGARVAAGRGEVLRPCEPDDVILVLDRLYRQRRIQLAHVRVMRVWGERHTVPDARFAPERGDAKLWTEAMQRLDWPLRIKGIVSGDGVFPRPEEACTIVPLR